MFGMGGSEIIVILIVALLFLGPDKLPQAAKSISKGIRDIKKQSRALQQQIESDEQIGGAIRDLKSALRGEDAPIRPKPVRPRPELAEGAAAAGTAAALTEGDAAEGDAAASTDGDAATAVASTEAGSSMEAGAGAAAGADPGSADASTREAAAEARPSITLPRTAGEADAGSEPAESHHADADELAAMIRPASGTVAKGS